MAPKINVKMYPQNVQRAALQAARRVHYRYGAFVRTTAARSMRKAPQMRLGEMSEAQREDYERRVEIAKREGRPKPRRPLKPSRPGEPPHYRIGAIRKPMAFRILAGGRGVIIGPGLDRSRQDPDTLKLLEFGGTARRLGKSVRYKPRPFMAPAREKAKPEIPKLWSNAIRG